jgi:Polyketide cyclase / dehydrase and lipid transport
MDVTASLAAPCAPAHLFARVDELTDYPSWMPLAHRVDVTEPEPDGRPAWMVELRARLGPFARSKRLRMVRVLHDVPTTHARFERIEHDGRNHSPWVLDVNVVAATDGSRLDMALHYGGVLWTGGVMERVLAEQIVAGRERLLRQLTDPAR